MQKSEINILIVEDDDTVLQSIVKGIEKAGYKPVAAKHADEALSLCKIKTIHAAIVDCMLPKKNGLDLSVELRSKISDNAPIFLMSGIFKDRNYASEAMAKTGALEFLYKPLDIKHVVNSLNESLKDLLSTEKVDLHVLLSQPFASQRERRKAFDHIEELAGYDLPFVFCILMDAESSGFLNIVSEDNQIYGVTLVKGQMYKVDSEESGKVIERLLIKHGFAGEDEIMKAQHQKGDLFKNLINETLVSPHVLEIIRPEQMVADLNHLITGDKVKINFVMDRKLKIDGPSIDLSQFTVQLHDMVDTLISQNWLKEFYQVWQGHAIKQGPQYSENHQLFSLPLFTRAPDLVKTLLASEPTIEEALEKVELSELNFLKALHLLMIRRIFVFDENKKAMNSADLEGRLNKMWKDLEGKDPFEVFKYFGVSEEYKKEDIERIYKEFARNNHPDVIPQDGSDDVKEVCHKLFSLVSDAHDILMDDGKKKGYLDQLKQKDAESQIKAEGMANEAVNMLSRGKFAEGFNQIKEARALFKSDFIELVYMWAFIKAHPDMVEDKYLEFSKQLKGFDFDSKKNYLFSFVSGLTKLGLKEFADAKVDLQKSLMVKNDFMVARRELAALKDKSKKSGDIFKTDISEIVGSFFKKKK